MGVFSNDFAAVDVREELCYHSLTEKAQIQRAMWYVKKKNSGYFKSEKKIPSQNSLSVTNKFDWVSCGGDGKTRTYDLMHVKAGKTQYIV